MGSLSTRRPKTQTHGSGREASVVGDCPGILGRGPQKATSPPPLPCLQPSDPEQEASFWGPSLALRDGPRAGRCGRLGPGCLPGDGQLAVVSRGRGERRGFLNPPLHTGAETSDG